MKEQIKASLWRQLCAVKVIIAQITVQAHPAQLQTAVYEHVRRAVTLLLVMSLPGIIVLAKIQITTRCYGLLFFCKVDLKVNKQLKICVETLAHASWSGAQREWTTPEGCCSKLGYGPGSVQS